MVTGRLERRNSVGLLPFRGAEAELARVSRERITSLGRYPKIEENCEVLVPRQLTFRAVSKPSQKWVRSASKPRSGTSLPRLFCWFLCCDDRRKMNDFERKVVSLPTTFMWSQH